MKVNKQRKRVLYIGGFEMPDGNAAAQRVLAIAKSLGVNYEICFLGLTHSDNNEGVVCGFDFTNLQYPKTRLEWIRHLSSSRELDYVRRIKPNIVIAYNFPALGLWRIQRYCKRNNIKIIGDVTEWYNPHNALKWLDTEWRMRRLHKKMDGLVVISSFLANYYSSISLVNIPPTVDLQSSLWGSDHKMDSNDKVTLLYVGSPGRGDKDRLDIVVDAVIPHSNLKLEIVGVTAEQYKKIYGKEAVPENISFVGRLSHDEAVKELKKADFSIFFREPSRANNAGFPTKYAEAAAAGVPVITNNFSDLNDIIVNGVNGFIAENTPVSIKNTVKKVAGMPIADIKAMRQYCKSHNERFDYRHYSQTLNDFVEEICDRNS